MLNQVIGLDHAVVTVRDLDAAAAGWRALGFTLSPRGTHSAHMGTGNYTIMLTDDYLELIGVLADTAHNAPTRAFLAQREGIERAAFTARDAAAGVAELQARGIAATGPMDFGRPVILPDGRVTSANFATFNWPVNERPGGMRIFACQHFTRDAVWIPELQRHANTATAILRLEMLAPDPRAAAEHMGRLIDRSPEAQPDGAWRVASGSTRGDFIYLSRDVLAGRYPGVALDGLADEGTAALVLRVDDLEAARRALAGVPVSVSAGRLVVPASHANGLMLVLSAD
ncbi:MAG: VOC family protein [Burkholderiales bacterium]|nr:VOC family protein [Burkholderiales bacterium]